MVFSKEGASPDLMKVEAIKQAEPPRNTKELNSFPCTVQYNARFMESYAPQTDVLRALVRADVFKWEEKDQEAFEALKNALSADTVLAYFNPAADHEVLVDGCPLGISATLVQRGPNEDHRRVVQYASRALSDIPRSSRRHWPLSSRVESFTSSCTANHSLLSLITSLGRSFLITRGMQRVYGCRE